MESFWKKKTVSKHGLFASVETHPTSTCFHVVNGDAYVTRIWPSSPPLHVSFIPPASPHYREKLYWVLEGTGCRPSISSAWLIVISRWSRCGENRERGFLFLPSLSLSLIIVLGTIKELRNGSTCTNDDGSYSFTRVTWHGSNIKDKLSEVWWRS